MEMIHEKDIRTLSKEKIEDLNSAIDMKREKTFNPEIDEILNKLAHTHSDLIEEKKNFM